MASNNTDMEPDEDKALIGAAMRAIGFKVSYQKQEKLEVNECCIYYSDVELELYSIDSYVMESFISILWHERVDKRLPIQVKNIVSHVEHFFIQEKPLGITFKFGKTNIVELGTSYKAILTLSLREEVDHN